MVSVNFNGTVMFQYHNYQH